MSIALAQSDREILDCFPVLLQLRPHLQEPDFVSRVRQQMQSGYQLAALKLEDRVVALAGFRLAQNLAYGKFMYVDDLVVDAAMHSQGYGQQLFQWLIESAKQQGCEQFHLDSGVQRSPAHRFYFQQRMSISSYHFALKLSH